MKGNINIKHIVQTGYKGHKGTRGEHKGTGRSSLLEIGLLLLRLLAVRIELILLELIVKLVLPLLLHLRAARLEVVAFFEVHLEFLPRVGALGVRGEGLL